MLDSLLGTIAVTTKKNLPSFFTGNETANICTNDNANKLYYIDAAEDCPTGFTAVAVTTGVDACYK